MKDDAAALVIPGGVVSDGGARAEVLSRGGPLQTLLSDRGTYGPSSGQNQLVCRERRRARGRSLGALAVSASSVRRARVEADRLTEDVFSPVPRGVDFLPLRARLLPAVVPAESVLSRQ